MVEPKKVPQPCAAQLDLDTSMETYGRLNKICVPIHTQGLKLFQPGYKLSEFWKGKDWRFQGVKLGTTVLGYAVSNLLGCLSPHLRS